ncbi:DUF2851 family protein [Mesonia aquimarina]|uniref:DUF2851 family protein n=1 Tax=Mesonia aquimarina TaxID=1504967 RepID=UPI000EF59411|nr:DUF2851 family protein [Mesonia aquimarina]
MREDFLHYIWKFKKFDFLQAETVSGKNVDIYNMGMHNQDESGPDFFNAKLKIEEQLWAGNVEIHVNSSDWYAHQHEEDKNYDNVILHVVWKHDVEVFRKDNTEIPCLVLNGLVKPRAIKNYRALLADKYRWINCEKQFSDFSDFTFNNWLERLYVERLQEKSLLINELLHESTKDWEAVLFQLLAKSFGLNKNGDAFLQMSKTIPFTVIRKLDNVFQLEALFFGQANMLLLPKEDAYYQELQKEYTYLKQRFSLVENPNIQVEYFRLRPPNFPTIRLSQLANLYANKSNLFSKLISVKDKTELYKIFELETSEYWKSHYSFEKETSSKNKKISKKLIDLFIINTIVPLQFCYANSKHKNKEISFDLIKSVAPEKNSITQKFTVLRKQKIESAMHTQALLQLKPNYCDKNRCLNCSLGLSLLQKNT